jgi:hypothetical protein
MSMPALIDAPRRELHSQEQDATRHGAFRIEPRERFDGEAAIDECVADLIARLVGMAVGHRPRGENEIPLHLPASNAVVLFSKPSVSGNGAVAAKPTTRGVGTSSGADMYA